MLDRVNRSITAVDVAEECALFLEIPFICDRTHETKLPLIEITSRNSGDIKSISSSGSKSRSMPRIVLVSDLAESSSRVCINNWKMVSKPRSAEMYCDI